MDRYVGIVLTRDEWAALANVLNVVLPDVWDMVVAGEVAPNTARLAEQGFDALGDFLDDAFRGDHWIEGDDA